MNPKPWLMMPKNKRWINRRRKEHYYKKAKKDGYSSRAAYKIQQIDAKYNLIKNGDLILDLCCAPGSWGESICRKYPKSVIVGIDLQKVNNVSENMIFIRGNILDDEIIDEILGNLSNKNSKFNVLLSDCAPKFTGARSVDLYKQYELTKRALEISELLLHEGGNCVIKLFQGLPQELREIEGQMEKLFSYTSKVKPDSSRDRSPEFYMVGKKKKRL